MREGCHVLGSAAEDSWGDPTGKRVDPSGRGGEHGGVKNVCVFVTVNSKCRNYRHAGLGDSFHDVAARFALETAVVAETGSARPGRSGHGFQLIGINWDEARRFECPILHLSSLWL